MEWKKEVTIPADAKDAEPGKIRLYSLNEDMLLLLIDIRSYKIPEIIPRETRNGDEKAFCINYCDEGRCELSLKDGSAAFLAGGELAVDYGYTVRDNESFYYPNRVYRGVELCFFPGEGLDRTMSGGDDNAAPTTGFKRFYMEQDRLLITRPDERVRSCFSIMEEDAALDMPRAVLLADVYRLLTLLGKLRFPKGTGRTYYTCSQVQIARLAMKELSDNLSKRISAASLAARFGVSESSLKNYFRGVYGKGYHEYLSLLRMEKASELLTAGGVKVSEVAGEVGYSSQSRFAKAFKAHFGVSPTEFARKAHIDAETQTMH